MVTASREQIAQLTSAEIARQIRHFSGQRDELTRTLAAIYAARKDGIAEPPPPTDRAKRVHEHAKKLMDGHAGLLPALPEHGAESEIWIRRDALDLILSALCKSETEAAATESLAWAIEHADEWKALCRDWILTAIRLEALEARASDMIHAVVFGTPGFPFAQFCGGGLSVDIPGSNLQIATAAAIKERIITTAEAKGASK